MPEGSDVDAYLSAAPWGDLEEFRNTIYYPLRGRDVRAIQRESGVELAVPAGDVEPLRAVIDGLAESYSGGTPWTTLRRDERDAVERLLAQMNAPRAT